MAKAIKTEVSVPAVSAAVSDTVSINLNITTVRDGGYQQAKVAGVSEGVTRGLMRLIPGLGSVDEPFTDEHKTELREGYMLRFNEIKPEVTYVAVDNQWVKESDLAKPPAKAERFIASAFTINCDFPAETFKINFLSLVNLKHIRRHFVISSTYAELNKAVIINYDCSLAPHWYKMRLFKNWINTELK